MNNVLSHKKILITRPEGQAEKLCTLIEEQGGQTIRLPVIKILPVQPDDALRSLPDRLHEYSTVIFISRNAVKYALALLGDNIEALKHPGILATGKATASLLLESGLTGVRHAGAYAESEALLELPELQSANISGSKILIFRGRGGRELLADTLRSRGAIVDYAEVYERIPVRYTEQELDRLWFNQTPDMIISTSSESLQNLFDMLSSEQRNVMLDIPVVVFGKRMYELAEKLGFRKTPVIANQMSDNGLFDAIMQYSGEKIS